MKTEMPERFRIDAVTAASRGLDRRLISRPEDGRHGAFFIPRGREIIRCIVGGPLGMFEKLRKVPPKKSDTAKWLGCLFCFSMTASAFVCVLLWLAGARMHYAMWFVYWCALSAVAIAINQQFTKGSL